MKSLDTVKKIFGHQRNNREIKFDTKNNKYVTSAGKDMNYR